jgi:hypothetical protein
MVKHASQAWSSRVLCVASGEHVTYGPARLMADGADAARVLGLLGT